MTFRSHFLQAVSGSTRWLNYHGPHPSDRSHRNQERTTPPQILTLASLNNTDRYLETYKRVKTNMGLAEGTDGIRGDECTFSEMAAMLRQLEKRIKDGSFVPQDHRQVHIPKGGGRYRTLSIPVVAERVIARTYNNAMLDVLDAVDSSVFPTAFHAYRRNRNIMTLFAQIAAAYARNGTLFLGTADIENAFPSTRKDEVALALARYVPDSDFCDALLRLSYVGNSQIELPQGLATSTTLFMMMLSHRLTWSNPGNGDDNLELLAYCDNLVYAGNSEGSISSAHGTHQRELQVSGMRTKASEPLTPIDVAHGRIDILGTTAFSRNGKIAFRPAVNGWSELQSKIRDSYCGPDPSGKAHSVMTGWIGQNPHILDSYGADTVINRLKGYCLTAKIEEVNWQKINQIAAAKSHEWTAMVSGLNPTPR